MTRTGGYSSKKSLQDYVGSCYSQNNVIVSEFNYIGDQLILHPKDVQMHTKNYVFEVLHNGENHLLSSVRYGLRVIIPKLNLSSLWARLELVDDKTGLEVKCVKRERAGKKVLKGKIREEFDISKHGVLKTKLDFRFRETSSDNTIEKYRLLVHILHEDKPLLTFPSPAFRTVVRSPSRIKAMKSNVASASSSSNTINYNTNSMQGSNSGDVDDEEDEEESEDESDSSKKRKEGENSPYFPPQQHPHQQQQQYPYPPTMQNIPPSHMYHHNLPPQPYGMLPPGSNGMYYYPYPNTIPPTNGKKD
ncbi:hypothetical protein ABK040_005024 [Willaertia magna]